MRRRAGTRVADSAQPRPVRNAVVKSGENHRAVLVAGAEDEDLGPDTGDALGFEVADAHHLTPDQLIRGVVVGDLRAGRPGTQTTQGDREDVRR